MKISITLMWLFVVINLPKCKAETNSNDGAKEINYDVPLTQKDLEWLDSLMELPKDGEIRIRKEYRQMTNVERNKFHEAINSLKHDKNVSMNKFDLLGNIHATYSTAAAAHNGPGFLGWHRVFLLMMENALRQKIPNVTVPYWDTTLDDGMSQPYYSVVWSEHFMGTGGGSVKIGPFKNWITPHGLGKLNRMIYAQGKLMNPRDIRRILKKRRLDDISFPNANKKSNIEEIHNLAHQWVGGQMRKIEHSAYDPAFYILHSFVDLLWEEFRNLQKKEGVDPNIDYPENYGIASHSPLAPMGLGKLVVIDGISDIWMKGIQYAARPQCNSTNTDCGSKYLKCNVKKSRCISYTYQEYNDILKASNTKTTVKDIESKLMANSSDIDSGSKSNLTMNVFNENNTHNDSFVENTTELTSELHIRTTDEMRVTDEIQLNTKSNVVDINTKTALKSNIVPSTRVPKSSTSRQNLALDNTDISDSKTLSNELRQGTTSLPSVFELYGLRWWLFKRDESSFQINPLNFWQMFHLKAKSPMLNFLNIFRKPKKKLRALRKDNGIDVRNREKSEQSKDVVHTNNNCLRSSATVSVFASRSIYALTSVLVLLPLL